MPLPDDVRPLLDELLAAARELLGDSLVGLYARGSLALGDFNPQTSDVDVLAVIERPLDAAQFEALRAMHARLDASPRAYARRLEAVYFDRDAVRRYPPGQRHATLGQGETLQWTEHGQNWLIERWTVREHGITLVGPDPRTLIDAIEPADIIAADRARMRDWRRWVDAPEGDEWERAYRGQMAYTVETMCRLRHAVEHGAVVSKPAAVAWALETFPEPWRTTVERSRGWRADRGVADDSLVPEVQAFVRWATAPA